jgi:hypothetical protein
VAEGVDYKKTRLSVLDAQANNLIIRIERTSVVLWLERNKNGRCAVIDPTGLAFLAVWGLVIIRVFFPGLFDLIGTKG